MSDNRKKPQRFVSKSYVISDDWAVSKIKAYLMGKGYEVKSKKSEDFEVDITAEKSGRVEYFEVETKTGYSFYNNETGSFLARKRKRKWESLSFWNVIVCREGVFFSNRHIYVLRHSTTSSDKGMLLTVNCINLFVPFIPVPGRVHLQ